MLRLFLHTVLHAVYLAQVGFDVLAVDQSGVGLQKALRLAAEGTVKIEVEQADLSDYKVSANSYAGIVSIYGHFDPATRTHIHKESLRGLMPGGFGMTTVVTDNIVAKSCFVNQMRYLVVGSLDIIL